MNLKEINWRKVLETIGWILLSVVIAVFIIGIIVITSENQSNLSDAKLICDLLGNYGVDTVEEFPFNDYICIIESVSVEDAMNMLRGGAK